MKARGEYCGNCNRLSFTSSVDQWFTASKRWGLLVYLLYAAFGLINATVNLAVLPPPHRIRITFLVLLAVFTAYILWRRKRFALASRRLLTGGVISVELVF